jgi:DNA-binding NarL/FixJ family response regulator
MMSQTKSASLPLRLLLADDHPLFLKGIKSLLEPVEQMTVIGEALDGNLAFSLAKELQPDVLVLDISMPGLDGLKLANLVKGACPATKMIALTVHEDKAYLRQLLEYGVKGYVVKRAAAEELVQAIQAVAKGGVYLDPIVAAKILNCNAGLQKLDVRPEGSELSERETEVLKLAARGYSNKGIAERLGLAVKSIETYKARGMEKLGFENRIELIRYAVSKGWLDEV